MLPLWHRIPVERTKLRGAATEGDLVKEMTLELDLEEWAVFNISVEGDGF